MASFFQWISTHIQDRGASALSRMLFRSDLAEVNFSRGHMQRAAELYLELKMQTGVFEIIGCDHVETAARGKGFVLRKAIEDVSVTHCVFDEYRRRGITIERSVSEPLIRALGSFFAAVNDPRPHSEIRAMVDGYLAEHGATATVSFDEFHRIRQVNVPIWGRLCELYQQLQQQYQNDVHSYSFGDIGLYLDEVLDESRYSHATPLNVRTFATTCGDGVHFSFLLIGGEIVEKSPIVVTVPGGCGNAIVGESLREFLSLGYYTGYSSMDCLTYGSPENYLKYFLQGEAAGNDFAKYRCSDDGECVMKILRKEFELAPWRSEQRFFELQEKYREALIEPPW